MRRTIFWVVMAGMGLALVLLVLNHEQGSVGNIDSDDFARMTKLVALLAMLSGGIVILFRQSIFKAFKIVMFWAGIGLVLATGYTYRFELRHAYERVMAELVPGRAASKGRIVEIARGRAGEFGVTTQVNGGTIAMVLDTGASAVVLTQADAKAAGLPLEVLSYNVPVDTANGRTRAAAVTLDAVSVGGLVERSVPALIAQPGLLRTSLLGMSFLNRLESWEVRGDKLILRGYP